MPPEKDAPMNAPDKFAQLLTLTREPFPASTKVHETGRLHPQLQVPKAADVFPADELAKAKAEWERRLNECPAEHRPYLVVQYATPVRNQYRVKAGIPL